MAQLHFVLVSFEYIVIEITPQRMYYKWEPTRSSRSFPIGCRSLWRNLDTDFFLVISFELWVQREKRDRTTTTNIDSLRECCVDSPFFLQYEKVSKSQNISHTIVGSVTFFRLFSVWFKYTRRQQTSSQRQSSEDGDERNLPWTRDRDNVDYLRNRWNTFIFKWMRRFRTQCGRSQTF